MKCSHCGEELGDEGEVHYEGLARIEKDPKRLKSFLSSFLSLSLNDLVVDKDNIKVSQQSWEKVVRNQNRNEDWSFNQNEDLYIGGQK